ncbi:J domain-containing protein [bacterium]|nr:J domain-containing protein [bacterium]
MPKEAPGNPPKAQGPVDAHPDLHGPESELGQAVDQTGSAISDAGKSISGAGHWLQDKVNQGAKWMTDRIDRQAEEDRNSWLGQTAIGRGLIDAEQTVGHFGGGLVKGVASLGTGLVSAAGGVVQLAGGAAKYAVNDKYRAEVNDGVARFAEDPGAVVRQVGSELKGAWDKDHADFLGQAVGVVGGTIATMGLGAARGAGAVAEGTEVAVAGRAGARGAEFVQSAARTEEAAAASAFRVPTSSNEALQVLGLKPGATAQEIKSAYRRMAQEYHPDRFPGGSELATQNMQAINVARDLLK